MNSVFLRIQACNFVLNLFKLSINPMQQFINPENLKVFWYLQGERKGALGTNGLSKIWEVNTFWPLNFLKLLNPLVPG